MRPLDASLQDQVLGKVGKANHHEVHHLRRRPDGAWRGSTQPMSRTSICNKIRATGVLPITTPKPRGSRSYWLTLTI